MTRSCTGCGWELRPLAGHCDRCGTPMPSTLRRALPWVLAAALLVAALVGLLLTDGPDAAPRRAVYTPTPAGPPVEVVRVASR
jgi:hypothetical protein